MLVNKDTRLSESFEANWEFSVTHEFQLWKLDSRKISGSLKSLIDSIIKNGYMVTLVSTTTTPDINIELDGKIAKYSTKSIFTIYPNVSDDNGFNAKFRYKFTFVAKF